MKKHLLCAMLLILLAHGSHAQYAQSIKRDASQMIRSMIAGDYKTAVKYIMPKFVTASGGPDKMAKSIEASLAPMIQDSVKFDFSIGEPGKVIKTPTGLYAVLTQKTSQKK